MNQTYLKWLKSAGVIQLITGCLHSLSLIAPTVANNEKEKQLVDLMTTYRFDLGAGFHPSMDNLMTSFSISFSLLLFFSGTINLILVKSKLSDLFMRKIIGANLITYILCFVAMSLLTFLPPIVCIGLIAGALLVAYLKIPNPATGA